MGIGFIGVDAVLLDRICHLGDRYCTLVRQRAQRGQNNEMTVYLEVFAQAIAEVRAAKAICAQYRQTSAFGQERTDLVTEQLDIVGGDNNWTSRVFQHALDIRLGSLGVARIQQAVTFAIEAVTTQLGKAGDAPQVGGDAPVFLEQVLCRLDFAQNGARSHQLNMQLVLGLAGRTQLVHALENAFFVTLRQAGMSVIFVHHRDVVEDVFLILDHAPQAILNDHGQLVRVCGIVGNAVGNERRHDMAMAVAVLQPFAIQCCPPGSAAQQEAACLHVAGGPGQIANPLESEHRVIDVKRNHDAVVTGVRRSRSNPGAERTGLVDALLQQLTVARLFVVHDLVLVDRYVLLTFGCVNADLAEQALHPERTGLVSQYRNHTRAQLFIAQYLVDDADECLCGRDFSPLGRRLKYRLEYLEIGRLELFVGLRTTRRQVTTQCFTTFMQILHFQRVVGRLEARQLFELVVGNGNIEAVAELSHRLHVQFFLLVGGILGLADMAHAVTLDGLGQNDRGLTLVIDCLVEGSINLVRVMAAAVQAPDGLVAHLADHFQQLGMLAEKVLAYVGAVVCFVCLVLAVDGLLHDFAKDAFFVARQKRIPVPPPDQLDDVPATATEIALELLDDFAV